MKTKVLINKIFDNNLSETEVILNSILEEKISSKLKDIKKKVSSNIATQHMDDSSGNNDLCDSSDNSNQVSEQDAFANIQKWRKHVRYNNPDRARDKNLAMASSKQKKLDSTSKLKEFK